MPNQFLEPNENGPEALKVIAKFLKPSGFFYHIFQGSKHNYQVNSQLLNFPAVTPNNERYLIMVFDLQLHKIK